MSINLTSDSAALTHILSLLSQPDTEVVRQAEKTLKPFLKQPSCVLSLINQIRTNTDESIRHHAALLLKKRAAALFSKFSAPQKQELKTQLLLLMTSESCKSIG